jgi:hypothetical protein
VDRPGVQIPVVVTAKRGENPLRRRGQGSLALVVSQGLAGPKADPNRVGRKGNRLIFRCRRGTLRGDARPSA